MEKNPTNNCIHSPKYFACNLPLNKSKTGGTSNIFDEMKLILLVLERFMTIDNHQNLTLQNCTNYEDSSQ